MPLQQITLSVAPAARKLEQPIGTVIDVRVKSSKGVSQQPTLHPKPITSVSFQTNWVSPINLARIVESHHIRIGDERWLMLVLNLYCSPRKHEAIVLGGTRVLKGWVLRAATKGTNSNQVAFEDHPVNFVYS
jgi:hypothetical protein